jgi:hypothetical protein
MQPTDSEPGVNRYPVANNGAPTGQGLAVAAEVLYLINLLVLPGLAFAVLLWVYVRRRGSAPPLAVCHLRQTFNASLWALFLLALVSTEVIYLGGYDAPYTWVVVILYFVTVHTTLVFLGIFGLARALAGRHFHYPLVGSSCNDRNA